MTANILFFKISNFKKITANIKFSNKQSFSSEKFLLLCDFFAEWTFKFEHVKSSINWLESLGWERISSDSLIKKLVK